MIETSLAPGLLLAMPHLHDPSFSRAVVLMIEHNDQGSFGLVVNQPGEMSARELLESLEINWHGKDDAMVWHGGPVMPGLGWILHDPIERLMPARPGTSPEEALGLRNDGQNNDGQNNDDQDDDDRGPGTILVGPHLALSGGSMERLRAVAADPPPHVRLLLGYAGWGPGQLAQEMTRGSWLHADVDLGILFDAPPEEMWERALRSLGIGPENIVQGVGIH